MVILNTGILINAVIDAEFVLLDKN